MSDKDNLSAPVHPPKEKPKKPGKKGAKALPVEKVTVKELFEQFEFHPPKDMTPCKRLYDIFKALFLNHSVECGLVNLPSLSLAGDNTPVCTAARERKKCACHCIENGIRDCMCDRIYSQPDCNIGFLYNWFSMTQFLPEAKVTKLLLDSAHDAMPYYEYCRGHGIVPFIDLNADRGRPPVYKNDFTISDDSVPVCWEGHAMRRDGTEPAKGRTKFKCPKIIFAGGNVTCTSENPCSTAKYGRTVHLAMKDNPRLFNDPLHSSKEWKLEYHARTSAEHCKTREKVDYKFRRRQISFIQDVGVLESVRLCV